MSLRSNLLETGDCFATCARNDIEGNWPDYETMMQEKFGKDLTPHRVKYRTLERRHAAKFTKKDITV